MDELPRPIYTDAVVDPILFEEKSGKKEPSISSEKNQVVGLNKNNFGKLVGNLVG